MEQILLAIGAAAIGAATTFFLDTFFKNKNFRKPKFYNKQALVGKWAGNVEQKHNEMLISYYVELDFKISLWGSVIGIVNIPKNEYFDSFNVSVKGGFFTDRILKLEYENEETPALQFGGMVLQLSGTGKSLEGCLVGYGSISEKIITGKVVFHKK
jgi:hypothetical protein